MWPGKKQYKFTKEEQDLIKKLTVEIMTDPKVIKAIWEGRPWAPEVNISLPASRKKKRS